MTTKLKRRDFLRTTTGLASGAALFSALTRARCTGAEPEQPHSSINQNAEKVLAKMEAQGGVVLNVSREDGRFLNLLIKVAQAKNGLEIGTSHGYSALWLALGLEETGGRLTTIEIQPDRVFLAKENFTAAGLRHRVDFQEGDAHQVVTTLDGPFDFIFLDADKDGQMDYFEKLFPKLIPGGLLLAHNAISSENRMRPFLDMIREHPELDSIILSMDLRDGFSLSYRHRA
jgi:caffeoyl-CoA O-methyltransferase